MPPRIASRLVIYLDSHWHEVAPKIREGWGEVARAVRKTASSLLKVRQVSSGPRPAMIIAVAGTVETNDNYAARAKADKSEARA